MPRHLSYTQWSTWQRCQYSYYLKYVLRIKPRHERPAISLGIAVHRGLAAGLLGESVANAIAEWQDELLEQPLFPDEEMQVEEMGPEAHAITGRTLDSLELGEKWDTVSVDGVPLVETKLECDLPKESGDWSHFEGHIDWVALELETGRKWLVDHKVRKSFQGDYAEEFNQQMALYKHLMTVELDIKDVYGSITHQIKSTTPQEPSINKNGSVGRQLITTDWPTYLAVIERQGQDPADYEDMRAKLQDVEWSRMSTNYWPDMMVRAVWNNMVSNAKAIQEAKSYPRTIGLFTCNGCRLREFCMADLRGEDTDFLLQTTFMYKDEEDKPLNPNIELEE